MPRIIRRFVRGILFLLLLVLVVIGGALIWIDEIARRGLEDGGEHALGVQTRAKRLDVGIFAGTLTIDELNIANPEGFNTPHLLKFSSCSSDLHVPSLFSDTIDLTHFEVAGLDVNIEQGLLKNNVMLVVKHLRARAGSLEKSESPGKNVRLDRIVIRDTTVHFELPGLPTLSEDLTVNVDEIIIEDLDIGDAGLPVAELMQRVVPKILLASLEASRDKLPPDMRPMADAIRQAVEILSGI